METPGLEQLFGWLRFVFVDFPAMRIYRKNIRGMV